MTDGSFLRQYESSIFEKPSISVDLLIFTIQQEQLKVLLVERKMPPCQGMMSLPGVFVRIGETLEEAVQRGLAEKVGQWDIYFEQLYTWGAVDRDPRMRTISVSYMALVPVDVLENTQKSSSEYGLYAVNALLEGRIPLAFDHRQMIACGRERIANKVEYTDVAFQFLPKKFTLPQLQNIYEILLDRKLYKANFRKKIAPMVHPTGEYTSGGAYRPSRIYERTISYEPNTDCH